MAALVAAVGVGLYYYSRLNDEIRLRVQAKFAEHYPNLAVTVRSAQLIDGQGVEIRGLSIHDPRIDGPQAELVFFDEIFLYCETSLQELLQHNPPITRMAIRRPRIQATRLPDGSWTAAQLLPLPKFGERPPDMTIEGGQVVVVDAQRDTPTTFTLRDIHLDVKPQVSDDTAGHNTCVISGSLAADHVQRIELAGECDKASGQCELRGTVAGIDVCPKLLAVLPGKLAERAATLSPLRGQADLKFHVRHDPAWSQPQFAVTGQLSSARFDAPELPQALPNIQAKFRADNRGIVIDEFSTRNGPTKIDLSASINGYAAGAPITIQGEAKHLLVGPQWEALLSPAMLQQWRKFLPAGEINVKNIDLTFDGARWKPQATVECLNVSFAFYRFPYQLQHGEGTVTLKDGKVDLNMTAYAGSRPVKIVGEFFNPGPNFTGWVEISGTEFPLDQNLYAAMSAEQPKSCEVVRSLNPAGTFNLEARIWRDDPRQLTMNKKLHVTLNRCSMRYDKFRYPLSNVTGELQMVDHLWTFRNLKGTNDSGRVRCEGSLTPIADKSGSRLHLEFTGDDVVLEDELRDALSPRIQCLWNDLKPRGLFKLVSAKVDYTSGDAQPSVVATVSPVSDTVSIDPSFFPYRLEQLKGKITFAKGRTDFVDMQAVHHRTQLAARGFCEYPPEGQWHVRFQDFTVNRLRLDQDPDLLSALPLLLRKAVKQLNPTGLMSLQGTLDLWGDPPPMNDTSPLLETPVTAETSPPDCNVRTQWTDLEIDMQQGTLQTGVALGNIHGGVVLSGNYDPLRQDGSRLLCRGELNVDSVSWNGFQFTDVHGPMYLDDRQVILGAAAEPSAAGRLPRHVSARCYEGTVRADAWVSLEETPRFSIQAALANGDLARFCIDALPGRQNLRGQVLASVNLTGNAAGLHTLAGQGEVQLTDADIYELPVMVRLLKVLNLRLPDTTAFTKSNVRFRIEGDHVLMDEIDFVGDAISLWGKGDMDLNTNVDLRLQPIMGRSDIQLPVWKAIMGGAGEQIMEYRVTGTLANPQVTRQAFPTLNQALQSIQAGIQPQDRPLFPQGMRLWPGSNEPQRR